MLYYERIVGRCTPIFRLQINTNTNTTTISIAWWPLRHVGRGGQFRQNALSKGVSTELRSNRKRICEIKKKPSPIYRSSRTSWIICKVPLLISAIVPAIPTYKFQPIGCALACRLKCFSYWPSAGGLYCWICPDTWVNGAPKYDWSIVLRKELDSLKSGKEVIFIGFVCHLKLYWILSGT